MFEAQNVGAGGRGGTALFRDDGDRFAIGETLDRVFGPAVLAFCPMRTHLHVLVEGERSTVARDIDYALRAYARARNRRATLPELLRGPIDIRTIHDDRRELARAIHYIHMNPVKTTPPIVTEPVFFEWGTARAYAGMSLAWQANVSRARALLGRDEWRTRLAAPELFGLEPLALPLARPNALLVAAAQVFGLLAADLASSSQRRDLAPARATYVHAGRLESYSDEQLALVLRKTRQRVHQLGQRPVDPIAVRIARTLCRDERFIVRLPELAPAS